MATTECKHGAGDAQGGENCEQNSYLPGHEQPLTDTISAPEQRVIGPGAGLSGIGERAVMIADREGGSRLICDEGGKWEYSRSGHHYHQQHQQPESGDSGVMLRVSGRLDSISSRDSLDSPDRVSRSSIVDDLLFEIYDRWNYTSRRYSYDSDTTYYSSTSDAFFCRSDSVQSAFDEKHSTLYQRKYLQSKDISELRQIRSELKHRVSKNSARLIRQLKNRDRHLLKATRNCDIITAILQASSLKRRIDSKIRFSIEPLPGEEAFGQWRDAMKAVARLPLGIPTEFRKKVWLALADNHIKNLKIDWEQTRRLAFNDRSNPDDNRLGVQIVKDLHRTGCSGFSGTGNEEDRIVLKRVLLAYARWNKKVGYCQGFNVLAALILDVMDRKEDDALKVMIYLVDCVLPESYFANNLRALSVDMAVFRDLLHIQLPQLSKHLDQLQTAARDDKTGANYEPPLTNVFTMQWFLTLFATCLPKSTALRVWDCVLLEGSEILLRTAVAIWGKLHKHIKLVQSADEFYTVMGTLSHKMLSCNMIEPDSLIKMVYSMGPLPMSQLTELREKYTYNITPFTAAMSSEQNSHVCSDDDDFDDDDFVENINCFGGIFPPQPAPSSRSLGDVDKSRLGSNFDISKASPGAYAAQPEDLAPLASMYAERMSLDINQLKQQYKKLRQRQKQAHIILAAASARHYSFKHQSSREQNKAKHQAVVTPVQSPVAVNHLFIGRQQTANNATNIVQFYPKTTSMSAEVQPSSKKNKQEEHLRQYRRTKQAGTIGPDGTQQMSHIIRSRSTSVDSSNSGTSTLKSSHNSGSTSDVSTCGIESDYVQTDTESCKSDSEQANFEDLIVFEDKVDDETETKSKVKGCTNEESNDEKTHDTGQEALQSCQEQSWNECSQSACSKDEKDCIFHDKTETSFLLCDNDSIEAGPMDKDDHIISKDQKRQQTLELVSDTDISETTSLASCSERQDSGSQSSVRAVSDNVQKAGSCPRLNESDNKTDVNCVTSVTHKSHKPLQNINGRPSTVVHAQSSLNNDSNNANSHMQSKGASLPAVKLFNPFPGQHVNSRRMKNGVKLGLYSAHHIPKLKTGITKSNIAQNIGKSQINNNGLNQQFLARN